MRFGLDDKYLDELTAILRSIPEIEEAVIYGSRARGDYRRASDMTFRCAVHGSKTGMSFG